MHLTNCVKTSCSLGRSGSFLVFRVIDVTVLKFPDLFVCLKFEVLKKPHVLKCVHKT